jgi:hypothetical protein
VGRGVGQGRLVRSLSGWLIMQVAATRSPSEEKTYVTVLFGVHRYEGTINQHNNEGPLPCFDLGGLDRARAARTLGHDIHRTVEGRR